MSQVEPGTVIGGRYRLVDEIGRGGMGTVWRAHDVVLDRQVAVKLMASETAATGDRRGGGVQEARAAARLTHPHITSVFDYGGPPHAPVPYIVMERLDGRSLADRLATGPLPQAEALVVAAQVSSALAAAHRRGVLHRDVTPNNIVLTADGAKVVDFGVSTIGVHGGPQTHGTPRYLAPEVAAGGPATAASDVYAFGMVLADLFPDLAEPSDADPRPGPAGTVAGVIGACRSTHPAARPAMAEVAETLRTCAGLAPVSTGTASETVRTRLRRAAATLRLPGTRRLAPTDPSGGVLPYLLAGGLGTVALVLLLLFAADPFADDDETSQAGTRAESPTSEAEPGGRRLRAFLHTGGDPSDNQVAVRFDLHHDGSAPIELSRVELRYWFTADDGPDGFEVWCDWAELGCEHVRRQVESLTSARDGADHVLVIGFTEEAGWLVPGDSTGEIQIRANKPDWSAFDESDDYSYRRTAEYTRTSHVTAYVDGELVWGTEPD